MVHAGNLVLYRDWFERGDTIECKKLRKNIRYPGLGDKGGGANII